MRTKVISLGGERADSFRTCMEGKLDFEFYDAFNKDQIEDFVSFFEKSNVYDYEKEKVLLEGEWVPNLWRRDSKAVIACAKSHLYLWMESFNKKENILILEDDVAFTSTEAENVFKKKPWEFQEFDIFYLDGEIGNDYNVRNAQAFHSGCSYIITPVGANKILTKIFESGYATAVDWELMYSQNYGMRSLSLNTAIFEQLKTEKSTLQI
jgi:GR25 family glycosyltransferase involved in LPS biosynthesis